MDEGLKGAMLSAFYWGYAVSQIPGGWAAQRWGGERVLSWSFASWSLAVLLTPGSAASTRAVAAARVCVGLAQVGGAPRRRPRPRSRTAVPAGLLRRLLPRVPATAAHLSHSPPPALGSPALRRAS